MIYACRRSGPAAVWIKNYKERIKLAALPASKTGKALEVISKAYPVYLPATNVLDTSLNNINFVLHPTSVLLNVVKIEQMGAYKYSHYDATPSVGKVMEAVDNEKIALTKALGMQPVPTKEILARYYGAKGNTFYEALVDCKTYKTQTAPDSTKYRYVAEDIPFGHVPMASIGEQVQVQTPTIRALITLASVINGTDYWSQGRTAETLGLSSMSAKQIVDYVTKG
jgi:opine dehydrogenase